MSYLSSLQLNRYINNNKICKKR